MKMYLIFYINERFKASLAIFARILNILDSKIFHWHGVLLNTIFHGLDVPPDEPDDVSLARGELPPDKPNRYQIKKRL